MGNAGEKTIWPVTSDIQGSWVENSPHPELKLLTCPNPPFPRKNHHPTPSLLHPTHFVASILIYVLLKSPFLMLKSTTFYFFYFSVIKQSYKTMVVHIFSWFHFPTKTLTPQCFCHDITISGRNHRNPHLDRPWS